MRPSQLSRAACAALALYCLVLTPSTTLADRLPDTCRLVLKLENAFWNYAHPDRKGAVTLYAERRNGKWAPTLSADARRGLNVAHDGYIVKSSSNRKGHYLQIRLHMRRDRWMDVVGEAAYDINFRVEDDKCEGTWNGVVHGVTLEDKVTGEVKPVFELPKFKPPKPGEHPRLLIRKSDIPTLRKKAETPWGKAQLAALQKDTGCATAQGLAYALTGDKQYAENAKARILKSAAGNGWFCVGGNQHDPAFRVVDQLMGFDLIYDAVDDESRQRVINAVADKLEMYYWGAYNTQFNGHGRSNWSLMFRSAAGLMALSVLDVPLDNPDTPAREELLHITPPEDLKIGKDVPVVQQSNEKPIGAWLYAGPLNEPFNGDGFKDSGGMAAARPEAGTKIGDTEFRLLSGQEVKEGRDLGSLEMRNGAVDLRKLTKGKYMLANYLYCVLEVKEAGYYWFESNKNPKGVRQRVGFLNGHRIYAKEHFRLDPGKYPLLVRVWNEPVGGWEPHVFWARFPKVDEKTAMAWHLPRAAGVKADELCGKGWRETVAKKTQWNLVALRRLRQAQHEAEDYFVKGLGDFGWNQEGEAYTRHAIRLGIPFAHCYRNVFGIDMYGAERLGKMMALCTAATVFSDNDAKMQSFAVGGGAMAPDLYSRAFGFVPPDLRPAVLGAWKKSMALAAADKLKDPHNIIASHDGISKAMRFINYPLEMEEKDPETALHRVTVDKQKGGYVFRNQWKDGDDCVVQLFANSNLGGGSWASSQGGTFRITGLGQYWAVRGQSYGNGASGRSLPDYSLYQNMVDVEGHLLPGSPQAWTTYFAPSADGSGIVSLNMNEIYIHLEKTKTKRRGRISWKTLGKKDLGIKAVRSLAVDYSGASGAPCLVAVADRLTGTPGTNTWQMTLPREHKVAVDGKSFIIKAKTGETLKGTVVLPANAEVSVVDHQHTHEINYHGGHSQRNFMLRAVLVKGADKNQDFLVVMTLQRGDAPAVTAKKSSARVGKQTISFDGSRIALGIFQ